MTTRNEQSVIVKWNDSKMLEVLLLFWENKDVVCPTCGNTLFHNGKIMNPKFWCDHCKTGLKAGR